MQTLTSTANPLIVVDGDEIIHDVPETPETPCFSEPPTDGTGEAPTPRLKYHVNDVDVKIINERVQYYDKDGKLIIESVRDYSRKNILGEYAELSDFLNAWNSETRKQAIIDELKERGVLLDALREAAGGRDIDDFDLICHIAFDKKPLTKAERVNNVKKRDYLGRYEGLAREVLDALLEKYAKAWIADLESVKILMIDPFRRLGSTEKIFNAFGGK